MAIFLRYPLLYNATIFTHTIKQNSDVDLQSDWYQIHESQRCLIDFYCSNLMTSTCIWLKINWKQTDYVCSVSCCCYPAKEWGHLKACCSYSMDSIIIASPDSLLFKITEDAQALFLSERWNTNRILLQCFSKPFIHA